MHICLKLLHVECLSACTRIVIVKSVSMGMHILYYIVGIYF